MWWRCDLRGLDLRLALCRESGVRGRRVCEGMFCCTPAVWVGCCVRSGGALIVALMSAVDVGEMWDGGGLPAGCTGVGKL